MKAGVGTNFRFYVQISGGSMLIDVRSLGNVLANRAKERATQLTRTLGAPTRKGKKA
jgi:hypothetical protein